MTPATDDFTAAEIALGRAYRRRARAASWTATSLSAATGVALGLTPRGARLIRAVPGRWATRAAAGGVLMAVAPTLAALPAQVALERTSRRFGTSTSTWRSWADDRLRALAVETLVIGVAAPVPVALARRRPLEWRRSAAALGAGAAATGSLLAPLLLEPVFLRFTPIPHGELRSDLLTLAVRAGVPVGDVLVADASRRTTAPNAYVSGLGPTRRVVVYDTLLRSDGPADGDGDAAGATAAPSRERLVRAVVAHELGHAARHDVARGTVVGAAVTAAVLLALGRALEVPRLRKAADVSGAGDPAAVPLLITVGSILGAALGPLAAALSRRTEARADTFSLDLTRDPESVVALHRVLALEALADVDPPRWLHLLTGSHPTTLQRIAAARAWAHGHGLPRPDGLAPTA